MIADVSIFDVVLVVTLVTAAARTLRAPDLFQAVIFFIVFGLLMSVAWTRLQAVDVALAEAAIGAGLTGALFLNALSQSKNRAASDAVQARSAPALLRLPMLLLWLGLAAVLGSLFLELPSGSGGLRELVEADIARSGASNPVTAVLLNFRAYDTLLEIVVLLLAVVGMWSLGRRVEAPSGPDSQPADSGLAAAPGQVLLAFVRLLIPLIGVVAGYLLWAGAGAPGGAFQSGAVLCAAGVLLLVTGLARPPALRRWPERVLLVLGFGVFLVVAVGTMTRGNRFLEYPPEAAGGLILLIEALLTVSIAIILVALFAGGESEGSPGLPLRSN